MVDQVTLVEFSVVPIWAAATKVEPPPSRVDTKEDLRAASPMLRT